MKTKIGVLLDRPTIDEGTVDISGSISLKTNSETIRLGECYLSQKAFLNGLREGDTIFYEPESIWAWKSGENLVGASYLKVNGRIIKNADTEKYCDNESTFHLGFYIVILILVLLIKWSLKKWWRKIPDAPKY